ncbi:MAG: hypothetical protein K2G63_01845 [Oscillospiraceae bacterium]|nr:hypothetical protein [Oscillospiraceae bacterium]
MSMYNSSGFYDDLVIPNSQKCCECQSNESCSCQSFQNFPNFSNFQGSTSQMPSCMCGCNMPVRCPSSGNQCCNFAQCQPSCVQAFAYIYNNTAQTVAVESDVSFNTEGINCGGITHLNGSSQITVNNTGVYLVWFYVLGSATNQFSIFVNGSSVPGSVYSSAEANTANIGFALVQLRCGDILSIRNHTSDEAVELAVNAGGSQQNVNASVAIYKIC